MTKTFILTIIIQVLRKKHHFSRTQNLHVSRNLNISVALYGWKTSQLFFRSKCKFSTYILHFYKRSLEKFRLFLRAIHYMTKAFTLTVIIQVLKKITNFSKTQVLYVSRNLNISVALYGCKAFKLFSFEECKLYVDLTVLQTLPWITLTSVFELSILRQKFLHWQ